MAVNVNTGFDDQDYLRDIRKVVLNPLAVKAASTEKKVEDLQVKINPMFQGATVHTDTKVIAFHQHNGDDAPIDLTGMFREGSDLTVMDGTDKTVPGVNEIKFIDSNVISDMHGGVELLYNWGKIVPDNQEKLIVGKTNGSSGSPTKSIFFKSPSVSVSQTSADLTTVEFPEIHEQLKASIPGGSPSVVTPVPIKSIVLEGDTASSALIDGKLTINLNSGGGATADENFKGFFESLGDIESQVQNPINNKSYAFAKDSKLGGSYFTPYFYVNSTWTELKQDPALTYSATTSPTAQGVFSIKPSEKITIDHLGQLNLDGLSTPQVPSHFKGFFENIDELKKAVPNPVLHQDWAYVKLPSGWMAYRSDIQGSARKWNVIAPMGSFAAIDRKENPNSYVQVYGIYKNDTWDVDTKGIMTLKPIDTTTDIIISSQDGTTTGGKVNTIKFESGLPYAEVAAGELTIKSPQQVISYHASWETAHPLKDYRGSIFYDATSRAWMGCDDPKEGGGVGVKWTRIAHRGMSDEVKSLVRRVPAKAPDVLPGVLEDSGFWHFNGVTFLESDSVHLPEELKDKCGGYITTTVQNRDAAGVDIPQYRMQTCTADRDEGGTWVRRFVSSSSPGSQTYWSKWVRTSFSPKDIEAHQHDLGAHKEAIKYYKVVSLLGNIKGLLAQTTGGALGGFHADNRVPVTDSYGYTPNAELDYISTPYSGSFRLKGSLSFSGYKDGTRKYPVGTWQILFRKKDTTTLNYAPVGQLRYEHTDSTKPFPVVSFLIDSFQLDTGQELIINLTFSDAQGISHEHPDLYIVPSRSFLSLEDTTTKAGSGIARSMRLLFGNIDTIGDVAIKSHHSTLTNPDSQIRVYGEKVNKTPVEMLKIS